MNMASAETANILRKTRVMYWHLVCSKNMIDIKDRDVHQRNVALEHIEHHRLNRIVYFADDDNIYSLELFENIRSIKMHFLEDLLEMALKLSSMGYNSSELLEQLEGRYKFVALDLKGNRI